MKRFCLVCPSLGTAIPDDLYDQLRSLPGVQLERISSWIVSLWFDGTEIELRTLLTQTAWLALGKR